MKVRSYINVQLEFIEELSEEEIKYANNNSNKDKLKTIASETLKQQLKADNAIVKSYRIEREENIENN